MHMLMRTHNLYIQQYHSPISPPPNSPHLTPSTYLPPPHPPDIPPSTLKEASKVFACPPPSRSTASSTRGSIGGPTISTAIVCTPEGPTLEGPAWSAADRGPVAVPPAGVVFCVWRCGGCIEVDCTCVIRTHEYIQLHINTYSYISTEHHTNWCCQHSTSTPHHPSNTSSSASLASASSAISCST